MAEPALKKPKVSSLLSLFEAQKDKEVPAFKEEAWQDSEPEVAEEPEPQAESEAEAPAEPKANAKAKAKAKAKAEAKAKAKAEAKAKAKAKAQGKAKAKAEKEAKSKSKGKFEATAESAKVDEEPEVKGPESDEKPESSEKPEEPGQSKVSAAEKLRQWAGALVADFQESEAATSAATEELDKRKTRHFEKHLHELPAAVQELSVAQQKGFEARQDQAGQHQRSGGRERLAAGAREPALRVDGESVL